MELAWKAKDDEAERKVDHALHAAIVDASQNATLIHMMSSIYELTKQGVFYNRQFLKSIDGSGKTLLEQHVQLGQASLKAIRWPLQKRLVTISISLRNHFVSELSANGEKYSQKKGGYYPNRMN